MAVVEIYPGPVVVRIHEDLESKAFGGFFAKNRYLLSVDLKFRESDALRNPGWLGMTRGEATREAKQLQAKLTSAVRAIQAAEASAADGDRHAPSIATVQRQTLDKITRRYVASFTRGAA